MRCTCVAPVLALVVSCAVSGTAYGALSAAERLNILWARALRQTDLGKFVDAASSARLGLRIAPYSADAWAVAAAVYASTPGADPIRARAAAQRALALDSRNARAHYAMGAVEYAAGNRVAAENCFRRATENDAGSARAHGMLAWALWDLGRYDEAVAATHDAARLEPGSFYWHQNLAIMSGELGQLPEALRESRIASQLAPNRTWEAVARNNRAYLLAYAGRLPEALTEATAALALNPQDPAVHDTAGLMYALSGQLGPAERHLRHALAAGYPSLPKLAYVLALRGDASGAREMLRSARSNLIGPLASMDALFPAGLAYDLLGEPDVTMRIFRQTAGLRPRHPWSAPMREYLARG